MYMYRLCLVINVEYIVVKYKKISKTRAFVSKDIFNILNQKILL